MAAQCVVGITSLCTANTHTLSSFLFPCQQLPGCQSNWVSLCRLAAPYQTHQHVSTGLYPSICLSVCMPLLCTAIVVGWKLTLDHQPKAAMFCVGLAKRRLGKLDLTSFPLIYQYMYIPEYVLYTHVCICLHGVLDDVRGVRLPARMEIDMQHFIWVAKSTL